MFSSIVADLLSKSGLHTENEARGENCDFSNCRGEQWYNREPVACNKGDLWTISQGDFLKF